MSRLTAAAAAASLLLPGVYAPASAGGVTAESVRTQERLALLRRAQVWSPTNVAAMDIRTGPPERGFPPDAVVTCDFVDTKFGGRTPKFGCSLDRHDVLKVRYGRDNGEVYAGVAATRLLWALGFGADGMYPAQIECNGCPATIDLRIAAIERSFRGRDIESRDQPGWSWQELDLVDAAAGGASRAQRDALKLLAVLLQHTDNKAEQQRLVCRDSGAAHDRPADCAEPFMMIHDVGQTFGRANLLNRASVGSVNLELWTKTPVWKAAGRCVGNLAASQTGTMTDPLISEAGRAFLAGLLAQLTDEQVHDLFTVARFADKPHGGGPVEAWVAAFKHKREEIVSARCG